MKLCRREKELAVRELEITQRELDLLRRASATVELPMGNPVSEQATTRDAVSKVNIAQITDLLGFFDGDADRFETWERQVRRLRIFYRLSDDMARIMIGSRLRGRATEWLHAKDEHVDMSIDDLLANLKDMFARKINKVALRRRFEERVWNGGKIFGNYLYDKEILASRVPIERAESINYIIKGIPDPFHQAKIQRFDFSIAEILR